MLVPDIFSKAGFVWDVTVTAVTVMNDIQCIQVRTFHGHSKLDQFYFVQCHCNKL